MTTTNSEREINLFELLNSVNAEELENMPARIEADRELTQALAVAAIAAVKRCEWIHKLSHPKPVRRIPGEKTRRFSRFD